MTKHQKNIVYCERTVYNELYIGPYLKRKGLLKEAGKWTKT